MASLERRPLSHHINELRSRLGWCLAALVAGAGLGYLWRTWLLHIVVSPLNEKLYYTSPGGGFSLIIQICLGFGVVVAIPVALYHALRFIGPALPKYPTRFIAGSLAASCLLVCLGVGFAYFVTLPAALHFLHEFSSDQVEALITSDTYLSFVAIYLAGFAILFQLPLLLLLANTVVPLPPKKLMGYVKWVILAAFIVAAVLTPTPDPFNQSIMAVPIVLLYVLSIGLVWLFNYWRKPLPFTLAGMEIYGIQHALYHGHEGFVCIWKPGPHSRRKQGAITFLCRGTHTVLSSPT